MTRSEFLAVTGMHLGRLKGLAQQRMLPFSLPEPDSKWARLEYSPYRAALLIAFIELTAGGMPVNLAAQSLLQREKEIGFGPIVRSNSQKGEYRTGRGGIRSLLPTANVANDVWLGIVATGEEIFSPPLLNTMKEISLELA